MKTAFHLRGERAKAFALRALTASGLLGWAAALASYDWLTSHDGGDPDQFVGGLLVLAAALAFLIACTALAILALNRKAAPKLSTQGLALGLGGSYVLGIAGVFLFLLVD